MSNIHLYTSIFTTIFYRVFSTVYHLPSAPLSMFQSIVIFFNIYVLIFLPYRRQVEGLNHLPPAPDSYRPESVF